MYTTTKYRTARRIRLCNGAKPEDYPCEFLLSSDNWVNSCVRSFSSSRVRVYCFFTDSILAKGLFYSGKKLVNVLQGLRRNNHLRCRTSARHRAAVLKRSDFKLFVDRLDESRVAHGSMRPVAWVVVFDRQRNINRSVAVAKPFWMVFMRIARLTRFTLTGWCWV